MRTILRSKSYLSFDMFDMQRSADEARPTT